MKIKIVLQARMNSVRLPNKALLQIRGTPIFSMIIGKLSRYGGLIFLTEKSKDCDSLVRIAEKHDAHVYRSDKEVFYGFLECVRKFRLDHVVRITGDCPLASIDMISFMTRLHLYKGADYTSNCHPVRWVPKGFDVEVFKSEAIERASRLALSQYSNDHVCPVFYENPDQFTIAQPDENYSIDTLEDYERMQHLL